MPATMSFKSSPRASSAPGTHRSSTASDGPRAYGLPLRSKPALEPPDFSVELPSPPPPLRDGVTEVHYSRWVVEEANKEVRAFNSRARCSSFFFLSASVSRTALASCAQVGDELRQFQQTQKSQRKEQMERFLKAQHHKVRSAVCPSVPSVRRACFVCLRLAACCLASLAHARALCCPAVHATQVEDSHHQMASASAAVETVRLKNLETGQEMRLNLLELKQSVHLEKQVHSHSHSPRPSSQATAATAKPQPKPQPQAKAPKPAAATRMQPPPTLTRLPSTLCCTPPPQVHSAKGRELVENAKHVQSAKVLERQLSHRGKRQAQGAKTKAEREV